MVLNLLSKFKCVVAVAFVLLFLSFFSISAFSAPNLSVSIYSDNQYNTNHAKIGDTIFIDIISNESLNTGNLNVEIGDYETYFTSTSNSTHLTAFRGTFSDFLVDSSNVIDFKILNIENTTGGTSLDIFSTTDGSSVIYDKLSPVFDSVILNPSSTGVLGIGDDIDYTLNIKEDDSSNGADTNRFHIRIGEETFSININSATPKKDFNNNNEIVPNGVYGNVTIYDIDFLDDAGNSLQGFSAVTSNIVVDTAPPTAMFLTNSLIGDTASINDSLGEVIVIDRGDQNFTYSINDSSVFGINSTTGEVFVSNISSAGEYNLEITANDSGRNSIAKNFTLEVTNSNSAPVISGLTNSTIDENITNPSVVGTILASDSDGSVANYSLADDNNGAFTINSTTGEISTATTFDFETQTSYNIVVNVTDDDGASRYEFITISIRNVNDAPTDLILTRTYLLESQTTTGSNIGSFIAFDLEDFSDQSSFTYSLSGSNATSFVISENSLNVGSSDLSAGVYRFNVSVNDSSSANYVEEFAITVTTGINGNSAPEISGLSSTSVLENEIFSATITADDTDGSISSYSLADNAGGKFLITGNTITGSGFDFETQASYEIVVNVTDDDGASTYAFITISIINVNEAPTDLILSRTQFKEIPVDANERDYNYQIGTFITIDYDDIDDFTYVLTSNPNNYFVIRNGSYLHVNNRNLSKGIYPISVRVTDSDNNEREETFNLNVTDSNDAPNNLQLSTNEVDENEQVGFVIGVLTATDEDGDNLSYTLASSNDGIELQKRNETASNLVVSTSGLDFEKRSSFEIVVSVSDGKTLTFQKFTITVSNVNEAPILLPSTFVIGENSLENTVVGTIIATDEDIGDILSYSIIGGNTDSTFKINNNGEIQVNNANSLDYEEKSSYSLTIQVSDGFLIDTANITINLNNVNEAPTDLILSRTQFKEIPVDANERDYNYQIGTFITIDYDDIDDFTYVLTSNPNNYFVIRNGSYLHVNNRNLSKGIYPISVRVTDSDDNKREETFNLNVTDSNDAPNNLQLSTNEVDENEQVGFVIGVLTATDEDGDNLSYTLASSNDGIELQKRNETASNLVVSTSGLDFEKRSSFEIVVSVSDGKTLTFQKFTITVSNVNEAPILLPSTFVIGENSLENTVVGTIIATDEDIGDILSYSIIGGNTDSTFKINNNGEIQVNNANSLDYEEKSSYSLTIQVSDGFLIDTANITINLNNVNEAPTDLILSRTQFKEIPVDANERDYNYQIGTFITIDYDDIDDFTYVLTSNPNNYFVIRNGSYLHVNNRNLSKGIYPISVRVTDSDNNEREETFNLNVTDSNDAPNNLQLSTNEVDENEQVGFVIGVLTATDEDGDNLSYTLASSNDGIELQKRNETASNLVVSTSGLDFEKRSSFEIVVSVSDGKTLTFQNFTINVLNKNEAVSLSNKNVNENSPSETVIGTFSTSAYLNNLTYEIRTVDGFEVDGNELKTSTSNLDFEQRSSALLYITTRYNGKIINETSFTINVVDVNEAPYFTNTDNFNLDENLWNNDQLVGTIGADDPDTTSNFRTLTYTITENYGTTPYFKIDSSNGEISISDVFDSLDIDFDDFENVDGVDEGFKIRITVSDGTSTITREVEIKVNNVDDLAPYDILFNGFKILESQVNESNGTIFNRIGTRITNLTAEDYDKGQNIDDFIFSYLERIYFNNVNSYTNDDRTNFAVEKFDTRKSSINSSENFNYEFRNNYYIKVAVNDTGNRTHFEDYEIEISDLNDNPTNITLSNNRFIENNDQRNTDNDLVDRFLAQINITDEDFNENFTLQLINVTDYDNNFSVNSTRYDNWDRTWNINETREVNRSYTNSSLNINENINFEDYNSSGTNPVGDIDLSVFNEFFSLDFTNLALKENGGSVNSSITTPATSGSSLNGLIDGEIPATWNGAGFQAYHAGTACNVGSVIKLDFVETSIEKIGIHARDGFNSRINGAVLELLNSGGDIVFSETISTSISTFNISVNGEVASSLILNNTNSCLNIRELQVFGDSRSQALSPLVINFNLNGEDDFSNTFAQGTHFNTSSDFQGLIETTIRDYFNGSILASDVISISAPIESVYYGATIDIEMEGVSANTVLNGIEPYLTLRLNGSDKENKSVQKLFNITLTDNRHEKPYDIQIDGTSFNETSKHNATVDLYVGNLTASDEDDLKHLIDETFTYTISQTYEDGAKYQIKNGSEVWTNSAFDYESQTTSKIELKVTDRDGLTYEERFTFTINNLHEQPVPDAFPSDGDIFSSSDFSNVDLFRFDITDNSIINNYGVTQSKNFIVTEIVPNVVDTNKNSTFSQNDITEGGVISTITEQREESIGFNNSEQTDLALTTRGATFSEVPTISNANPCDAPSPYTSLLDGENGPSCYGIAASDLTSRTFVISLSEDDNIIESGVVSFSGELTGNVSLYDANDVLIEKKTIDSTNGNFSFDITNKITKKINFIIERVAGNQFLSLDEFELFSTNNKKQIYTESKTFTCNFDICDSFVLDVKYDNQELDTDSSKEIYYETTFSTTSLNNGGSESYEISVMTNPSAVINGDLIQATLSYDGTTDILSKSSLSKTFTCDNVNDCDNIELNLFDTSTSSYVTTTENEITLLSITDACSGENLSNTEDCSYDYEVSYDSSLTSQNLENRLVVKEFYQSTIPLDLSNLLDLAQYNITYNISDSKFDPLFPNTTLTSNLFRVYSLDSIALDFIDLSSELSQNREGEITNLNLNTYQFDYNIFVEDINNTDYLKLTFKDTNISELNNIDISITISNKNYPPQVEGGIGKKAFVIDNSFRSNTNVNANLEISFDDYDSARTYRVYQCSDHTGDTCNGNFIQVSGVSVSRNKVSFNVDSFSIFYVEELKKVPSVKTSSSSSSGGGGGGSSSSPEIYTINLGEIVVFKDITLSPEDTLRLITSNQKVYDLVFNEFIDLEAFVTENNLEKEIGIGYNFPLDLNNDLVVDYEVKLNRVFLDRLNEKIVLRVGKYVEPQAPIQTPQEPVEEVVEEEVVEEKEVPPVPIDPEVEVKEESSMLLVIVLLIGVLLIILGVFVFNSKQNGKIGDENEIKGAEDKSKNKKKENKENHKKEEE